MREGGIDEYYDDVLRWCRIAEPGDVHGDLDEEFQIEFIKYNQSSDTALIRIGPYVCQLKSQVGTHVDDVLGRMGALDILCKYIAAALQRR